MWAPDNASDITTILFTYDPTATDREGKRVDAGADLVPGQKYILRCSYSGTDPGHRDANYTRVAIINADSTKLSLSDIRAEATPVLHVENRGVIRTWTAAFTMPKASRAKSDVRVALLGTYGGGDFKSGALRGFATADAYGPPTGK